MSDLITRDVDYRDNGTRMVGHLCAPAGAARRPGVLLIHDAHGLSQDMIDIARRLAGEGVAVLAADVWGDRHLPESMEQIGPLVGGMVADRDRWIARIAAAHVAAAAQPEIDEDALVLLGYCFGGSSALEYLRAGGDVAGVISIHGGLDLLEHDWSAATGSSRVLLCSGADDPMATADQREQLQAALSKAGVDWELDLYGDTTHAFTSLRARSSPAPELFAYQPRSAARAWAATLRFLHETFPTPIPS